MPLSNMFALHLQSFLAELCREAELSAIARDDMEQRFQSLRGNDLLPRGRENRARPLTDEQIVAAVLGLATTAPGWAGHAATVLKRRFPVGGVAQLFAQAPNLTQALVAILSDETVRQTVVAVRLSTAEGGVNSHGFATIIHGDGATLQRTHYVPAEAVSLLQPDAQRPSDGERRHAPFSREVVFDRRFFEQISKRVARDRAHPLPLPNDSAEYDSEEAARMREQRLRCTISSHFLNVGVDNQVTWPREEMLITFDRYQMVLLPKTKEHVQSISIDLHRNGLTVENAQTVINRFLSLVTWCDDQYAIMQDGWGGNPVPVPVAKRDLAFSTTYQWLFDRNIPVSEEVRRALALYREARNAEQNFMVSYAVLNYYKIIELRHQGWKASTAWVAENLPPILDDPHDRHGIKAFLKACGEEPPELYIYAACRVAVAHASPNRASDPDDAIELRRLHNAADIMRRLARRFIAYTLGVSESPFILEKAEDAYLPCPAVVPTPDPNQ